MALTLTIGTSAAAGLALAGAGIGAGLLGAIGLGVLARGRQGGRRGGRRRGGGFRRFGRSIETRQDAAMDALLTLVRKEDVSGCGLKLMCHLAGVKEEDLPPNAADVLALVSDPNSVRPGEGVLPPGGAGDYLEAKKFGHNGGDCERTFYSCTYNAQQLVEVISAV